MMKKRYADVRHKAKQGAQPYHLREMDSVPFAPRQISPAFRSFCGERVLPGLKIIGYKQDQKRQTAMQCCLVAIKAELADKVIGDSRSTHNAGVRQRKEAWDLLVEAGFCRRCLGSEESRKVTRYRATKKLMELQRVWKQTLLREPKQPSQNGLLGLVVFKRKEKGKSSEVPFEEVIRAYALRDDAGRPDASSVSTMIAVTRVIEEILNQINSVNLDHSWKTTNEAGVFFQPSVELAQIHIGELWRGTRLYTRAEEGGQNITKAARARMTIDREPVTELDISGSIPRLAYNLRKIDVPAGSDVYAPNRIIPEVWRFLDTEDRRTAREFIKKATLRCFNVSSRSQAIGAIMKQLREHPEADRWPISGFPSPAKLVQRVADVHRSIAKDLFADRGMKLVTVEGQIMLHILRHLVLHARKPALAVHDALVIRKRDAKLARAIMEWAYRQRTGYDPVIKSKTP